MGESLRWGILGTGNIAQKFADQLRQTPAGELVAVGSRSTGSAQRFASKFGGGAHGSYAGLVADTDVEAVYIPLPNSLHFDWTMQSLAAGKHVLCEKPIATCVHEAEEMFAAAERAGLVLVEAFMYRCQPAVQKVIDLVGDGAIGELKLIRTHFTYNRPGVDDIRFQPSLGGGGLLDVGCYCVNFARALAGDEPTNMFAAAHRHASGVDDYAAGTLDFGGRVLTSFTCGMTVSADLMTTIAGSEGYIVIERPWFSDGKFTLFRANEPEMYAMPNPRGAYALEAEAFARCVRGDEPPWITGQDSLGNVHVLQRLLETIGS